MPYSPAEMFALVDDIEAYPQFLPGCRGTRVLSRSADEVRATIELSKGGVEKAFTTCNRSQQNKMIEVRLVEGPFKHLNGFWRFDPLGEEGCKVSLDLEFEFASRERFLPVAMNVDVRVKGFFGNFWWLLLIGLVVLALIVFLLVRVVPALFKAKLRFLLIVNGRKKEAQTYTLVEGKPLLLDEVDGKLSVGPGRSPNSIARLVLGSQ